jgi:FkbM family methyltransferase
VLAFEPNPAAFPILAGNLARLPVPAEAVKAAVHDFTGAGELRTPGYNVTDHAKYLVPHPEGDVSVVRLDEVDLPPLRSLVLKIDVEGAEPAVIRGARAILAGVSRFVVTFEAHPDVAARTGVDPVACLRLLEEIAPIWAYPSNDPARKLAADRPFFDQVAHHVPQNVICVRR